MRKQRFRSADLCQNWIEIQIVGGGGGGHLKAHIKILFLPFDNLRSRCVAALYFTSAFI